MKKFPLGATGYSKQVSRVRYPVNALNETPLDRRGIFTTFWFFRYTRLAKRIADPELRSPQPSVIRTLWIGFWAGCLGILFSMLVMMSSVGRLLVVLMATPPTGVPVVSPVGGDPTATLSAIDAVSMPALLFTLTAEFIVLAFSLWLLFRVTRPAAEISEATD